MGRPFRQLTNLLYFRVNVWASDDQEMWVDKRLEWAKSHPGIGFPETDGLEFESDESDVERDESEDERDDLEIDTP
jgi:hypothetical protein